MQPRMATAALRGPARAAAVGGCRGRAAPLLARSASTSKESAQVAYADESDWRRYLPETWVVRFWNRAMLEYEKYRGANRYPAKLTICNSGTDFGVTLPRPELVLHDDLAKGSQEWKMQLYGAALYWHMATTPGKDSRIADPDMLRGKDVLEVACMRGGGARYLAEVAGPQLYVGADAAEDHVKACRERHSAPPGLRFEVADLCNLNAHFPASSFDYVLCVEPGHVLEDAGRFVAGVSHVLRPGGRLVFCDLLPSDGLQKLLKGAESSGLSVEVCADITQAVVVAALRSLPGGHLYLRIVARKDDAPATE